LQGVVGLSTQVGRSRRLQESSSPVEEALAWTTRAQEVESEMLSVAYGSNSDSPLLSAAFEPPRRLAAAAPGSQLNVIWGLKVRKLGPFDLFVQTDVVQMWDFDEMFDPADPWAQRSLMQMGEVLSPGLLATSLLAGGTWIAAYEEWLLGNGLDFPARDFHSSSEQFVADRPDYKTGVLRDGAQIKALKMDFRIGVASVSGLSKSLEVLQAWDQHVQTRNEQASMRANSAFHTSSLWVRVAAQNGILTSTASSVLISVMLGFVFAMAFTGDFVLSLLPMASVVLTVVALLFVMVGLLQWPFGAIDVIGLIVFLGYMFTFNLHMVHSYHAANVDLEGKEFLDIDAIAEEEATTPWIPAEGPPVDEEVTSDGEKVKAAEQRGDLRRRLSMAEVARDQADQAELRQPMVAANTKQKDRLERFERSKHALTTMGQSLLCSGITSSACAIFLVACTLQFFVKFGVVILAVTVLSLLHSLVFLPALLMLLGPTQNSCASLGHLRVRAIEALKALNARQMPLLELHVTGVLRAIPATGAVRWARADGSTSGTSFATSGRPPVAVEVRNAALALAQLNAGRSKQGPRYGLAAAMSSSGAGADDHLSSATGGRVLMASSVDGDHPPDNVIDGDEATYWISTGLYPQEILFELGKPATVSGIWLSTTNVRMVRIEGCVEESAVTFETLASGEMAAPSEAGRLQLQ
ncbi:unnamed protein product, partial [Polarella glacialis]